MMDLKITKVTCRFLVITACLITGGLGLAEPSPDEAAFRKEVERKHAAAIAGFDVGFGLQFEKKFPNHKIFSYCLGSFKNAGYDEYALGVLSPSGEGLYVVLLDGPKDDYRPVIISRFKPLPIEITRQLEGPNVQCDSSMGLKRLNRSIRHSIGVHGEITPINNYDGICVVDDDSRGYTYTCYAYDVKKKEVC